MYRQLSLLSLIELISHNGNKHALQELHNNRSVFYYHSENPIRLVNFVDALRQSKAAWRWCNGQVDMLDGAYDLTISKFSNLPDLERNDSQLKEKGPNCRYYYGAFLKYVTEKMKNRIHQKRLKKYMKRRQIQTRGNKEEK